MAGGAPFGHPVMDAVALKVKCGSCQTEKQFRMGDIPEFIRSEQPAFQCVRCGKQQKVTTITPQVRQLLGTRYQKAYDEYQRTYVAAQAALQQQVAAAASNPQLFQQLTGQLRAQQIAAHAQQRAGQDAPTAAQRAFGNSGAAPGSLAAIRGMDAPHSPEAGGMFNRSMEEVYGGGDDDELVLEGEHFADYAPRRLMIGVTHPDPVVESASLAAVLPPPAPLQRRLRIRDAVASGVLSGLQLESIVYSLQRHRLFQGGFRCGFFIGDGAGVGKGRTIAGMILENWLRGRRKHIWVSVSSDLLVDAERDLRDVGATEIVRAGNVHALQKKEYGPLSSARNGVREGVVFMTYSALVSGNAAGRRGEGSCNTRLDQLVEWCGPDFDGLIVFDESHKAKNLVPAEKSAKPSKTGLAVLAIQERLPRARVVYCSATGASEPRNMGYMVRLGLWGPGAPAFHNFGSFLTSVTTRGMGTLEMTAMDMKARGMFVCRTLSFKGAEFSVDYVQMEERMSKMYTEAAWFWVKMHAVLTKANDIANRYAGTGEPGTDDVGGAANGDAVTAAQGEDLLQERATKRAFGGKGKINRLWNMYWATHQRFFRSMCMAAKVPALVKIANEALEAEKCVVIGLQTTGEARIGEAVERKKRDEGVEDLDDFISGPQEQLLKLVKDWFPMPPNPGISTTVLESLSRSANAAAKAEQGCKADDEKKANDSAGRGYELPVPQSPEEAVYYEAWLTRQSLLDEISRLDLPANPLDDLIDQLGGPEQVAEMTGRKARLVRSEDGKSVKYEARNATGATGGTSLDMLNIQERAAFQAGKKYVAVISEAASAGISLQADRRVRNQRRRVHITLELPWSADRAVQQFGRSHRANQVSAPEYRLLFTPLGGERRFACSVAARLESLGALTQGDRRAGLGLSMSEFNFETDYGRGALREMYTAIIEGGSAFVTPRDCQGDEPELPAREFYEECRYLIAVMGIAKIEPPRNFLPPGSVPPSMPSIGDPDSLPKSVRGRPCLRTHDGSCTVAVKENEKGQVNRFLNRLLGLPEAEQTQLFDFFQQCVEEKVRRAKREGRYDQGITELRGTSVRLLRQPETLYRDPTSGAPATLYEVVIDRGVSWETVLASLEEARAEEKKTAKERREFLAARGLGIPADIRETAPYKTGFYMSRNEIVGATGPLKHLVAFAAYKQELFLGKDPGFVVVRPKNCIQQRKHVPDFERIYEKCTLEQAQKMWEWQWAEGNLPLDERGPPGGELIDMTDKEHATDLVGSQEQQQADGDATKTPQKQAPAATPPAGTPGVRKHAIAVVSDALSPEAHVHGPEPSPAVETIPDMAEAKAADEAEIELAKKLKIKKFRGDRIIRRYLLGGVVLSLWDLIEDSLRRLYAKNRHVEVARCSVENVIGGGGSRIIGIVIPPDKAKDDILGAIKDRAQQMEEAMRHAAAEAERARKATDSDGEEWEGRVPEIKRRGASPISVDESGSEDSASSGSEDGSGSGSGSSSSSDGGSDDEGVQVVAKRRGGVKAGTKQTKLGGGYFQKAVKAVQEKKAEIARQRGAAKPAARGRGRPKKVAAAELYPSSDDVASGSSSEEEEHEDDSAEDTEEDLASQDCVASSGDDAPDSAPDTPSPAKQPKGRPGRKPAARTQGVAKRRGGAGKQEAPKGAAARRPQRAAAAVAAKRQQRVSSSDDTDDDMDAFGIEYTSPRKQSQSQPSKAATPLDADNSGGRKRRAAQDLEDSGGGRSNKAARSSGERDAGRQSRRPSARSNRAATSATDSGSDTEDCSEGAARNGNGAKRGGGAGRRGAAAAAKKKAPAGRRTRTLTFDSSDGEGSDSDGGVATRRRGKVAGGVRGRGGAARRRGGREVYVIDSE
ncbi:unnamed protein product [Pedinophyceae sp. YPF-701]|nr:unnamed protein product [Pedinophyceae sp. YPF-701]